MQIRLSLSAALLLAASSLAILPMAMAADPATPANKKAARDATKDMGKQLGKALKSGDVDQAGTYHMGPDELSMDCKRLTGSMKITISRLRDAATRKGASSTAEQAHKTMPTILGGSTAGADRQASLSRERAKLDAYNRQLASKKCKTFDVDAELARGPDTLKKY